MAKVLGSSPTIIGLTKILNQYYYSTSYTIYPDLTITNSKGVFDKLKVKKKGSRYQLIEP